MKKNFEDPVIKIVNLGTPDSYYKDGPGIQQPDIDTGVGSKPDNWD